jgi:molybdopterin/thiamine biosynthesis adenylyltransferase
MKKMASSNVLIVGMKGLGVEIGELHATCTVLGPADS